MIASILYTNYPILIQDEGRFCYNHLGVSTSGAADLGSYNLAQRLLGNTSTAGAWEITFGNVNFTCDQDTFIACTGAPVPIIINEHEHSMNSRIFVPKDSEVKLGSTVQGFRTYIAFRGGLDIPLIMGSKSTDTLNKIGPNPLTTGDKCLICDSHHDLPSTAYLPQSFILPRNLLFTSFYPVEAHTKWVINSQSNRVGIRLDPVAPASPLKIPALPTGQSTPMFRGAIEITPSNQLIIFSSDHPTTGGYTRLGSLTPNASNVLSQLLPGQEITLTTTQ